VSSRHPNQCADMRFHITCPCTSICICLNSPQLNSTPRCPSTARCRLKKTTKSCRGGSTWRSMCGVIQPDYGFCVCVTVVMTHSFRAPKSLWTTWPKVRGARVSYLGLEAMPSPAGSNAAVLFIFSHVNHGSVSFGSVHHADYAATKGWCDFEHPAAAIPALTKVGHTK
jgi:hypothetical protein